MRPTNMRCSRTVGITAGALAIAAPASAVALSAGPADAQGALQINPASTHLSYGHELTVRGLAPASDRGYRLALQFTTGRGPWRTIARAHIHTGGAFRLRAPLTRSGEVRVVPLSAPATATAVPATSLFTAPTGPASIAPSPPQPITVAARLVLTRGPLQALPGHPLAVHGRLLPQRGGAVVRLQVRTRHHWRTVAVARTRRHGGFVLRRSFGGRAPRAVRVRFPGDPVNTAVSTTARRLGALHPVLASWYYDAGNTACGFHAGYGVASPYLPCGTRVTFAYHGHSVTAVVDDRGPFVPGRVYDLNQNTAAALGFGGVDTVLSSV